MPPPGLSSRTRTRSGRGRDHTRRVQQHGRAQEHRCCMQPGRYDSVCPGAASEKQNSLRKVPPLPPSSGRIGMTITLGLEAMRNPRQYAAPRLVIPNPHAKRAGEGPYETCAAAWTQPGVPMLRAAPEDAIRLPSATSQKLGPSPALLVGQARDDIQNEPKSGNPQASK